MGWGRSGIGRCFRGECLWFDLVCIFVVFFVCLFVCYDVICVAFVLHSCCIALYSVLLCNHCIIYAVCVDIKGRGGYIFGSTAGVFRSVPFQVYIIY